MDPDGSGYEPGENTRLQNRFPELISNVSECVCNVVNHTSLRCCIITAEFHLDYDFGSFKVILKNILKKFFLLLEADFRYY